MKFDKKYHLKKDYNGYVFTVMDRSAEADPNWVTVDVFSEGENADPINDAVYQRNRIIEEAFNIKIAEKQVRNPSDDARKLISADDRSFDVFSDGVRYLAQICADGYLYPCTEKL